MLKDFEEDGFGMRIEYTITNQTAVHLETICCLRQRMRYPWFKVSLVVS